MNLFLSALFPIFSFFQRQKAEKTWLGIVLSVFFFSVKKTLKPLPRFSPMTLAGLGSWSKAILGPLDLCPLVFGPISSKGGGGANSTNNADAGC